MTNAIRASAPVASPGLLRAMRTFEAMGQPQRLEQSPDKARYAAAQLASQLFFAPLLAEMRKLPFGRELAVGGRMEEAFAEQLDLHLADKAAMASHTLVKVIEQQIRGRHGGTEARRHEAKSGSDQA